MSIVALIVVTLTGAVIWCVLEKVTLWAQAHHLVARAARAYRDYDHAEGDRLAAESCLHWRRARSWPFPPAPCENHDVPDPGPDA